MKEKSHQESMMMEQDIRRKVPEKRTEIDTLKIAIMAILTAVETIATIMIDVPIPGSNGYFNVGEAIIYFTAICFGAKIGAFVGGVGASMADIILGAAWWAPGTFVIKATEGFVVGYLFEKLKNSDFVEENWKSFTMGMGTIFGVSLVAVGFVIEALSSTLSIVLGAVLFIISIVLGFTVQKDTGQKLAAIIPGGIVLVLGYFLYIAFVLNSIKTGFYSGWATSPMSAALWEVPWDFMQFLISTIIAIPLIAALEPFIKKYV